jgi:hypothetical protein
LQELQNVSFSTFMCVDDFSTKAKAKGALPWPTFISNITIFFFDVLIECFFKQLPPCRDVDHKIRVASNTTLPFKLSY